MVKRSCDNGRRELSRQFHNENLTANEFQFTSVWRAAAMYDFGCT